MHTAVLGLLSIGLIADLIRLFWCTFRFKAMQCREDDTSGQYEPGQKHRISKHDRNTVNEEEKNSEIDEKQCNHVKESLSEM